MMLVFSDPATNRRDICTAALVAPRLVLTARHCVAGHRCRRRVHRRREPPTRRRRRPLEPRAAQALRVHRGARPGARSRRAWKPARDAAWRSSTTARRTSATTTSRSSSSSSRSRARRSLRCDSTATSRRTSTSATVGWGVTSHVDEPPARQQRTGVSVTRVGPTRRATCPHAERVRVRRVDLPRRQRRADPLRDYECRRRRRLARWERHELEHRSRVDVHAGRQPGDEAGTFPRPHHARLRSGGGGADRGAAQGGRRRERRMQRRRAAGRGTETSLTMVEGAKVDVERARIETFQKKHASDASSMSTAPTHPNARPRTGVPNTRKITPSQTRPMVRRGFRTTKCRHGRIAWAVTDSSTGSFTTGVRA